MSKSWSGGSTSQWRRLRRLVLDRDGGRCQLPGPDGQLCGAWATHVDHVTPKSHGGLDVPANLRAACAPCNLRRGNRDTTPPAGTAVAGRASGTDVVRRRRPAQPPGWSW